MQNRVSVIPSALECLLDIKERCLRRGVKGQGKHLALQSENRFY